METIQKIRELEKLVIEDAKQINSIIHIRKYLSDCNESNEVRMAALHAMRRIFVDSIDNGRFSVGINEPNQSTKKTEYLNWMSNQYTTFQESLLKFVKSQEDPYTAPAIRTIMEFVKREYKMEQSIKGSSGSPYFGEKLFQSLLNALVTSASELDIDLLLMLKEEVFEFHDCTYYGFVLLRDLMLETKDLHADAIEQRIINNATKSSSTASSSAKLSLEVRVKNLIDLLRVLAVPSELEEGNYLVPTGSHADNAEGDADSDAESGNDSSDDKDDENLKPKKGNNKRTLAAVKKTAEDAKKKKRKSIAKHEQVYHLPYYRKAFSKAWLSLLSLPLTISQHKLLLKHLSQHVMGVMAKPILLADYLTQSYNEGGAVAVLALESLFTLIATYNLDYPNFFLSLYNLCTVEVFSAKYRNKFMKLLNMSLKSINLPAYLVAAFIKRLAFLSLHTPSPNAPYLIGQIAWLLRNHAQTQVLIHRTVKEGALQSAEQFNNKEDKNVEEANALKSSLWELEFLEKHHLYSVASAVALLKDAASTNVGRGAKYVPLDECLDMSYADMLDAELNGGVSSTTNQFGLSALLNINNGNNAAASKKGKKPHLNAALAYKKPEKLIGDKSLIRQCFGTAQLQQA